jgi:putative transposase
VRAGTRYNGTKKPRAVEAAGAMVSIFRGDTDISKSNRGHKARLYPTPEQAIRLHEWSGHARFLWNLARDQRRWFKGFGKASQCAELTRLREELPWFRDLPAQVSQQVIADLDLAWQRCYAGLSRAPAPKKRFKREAGMRFPQKFEVKRVSKRWGAVKLTKLGWIRFRWTRDLAGTVKNVTVTRTGAGWDVAFCLEARAQEPVKPNRLPSVGVDRGVAMAFMTSAGEEYDTKTWTQGEKDRLLALERQKAIQKKGSGRFCDTCEKIAKLHHRATNRRHDFAHKVSSKLAKNHGLVVVEALQVRNMTKSAKGTVEEPGSKVAQKSGLNRSILDKGWGLVNDHLKYKCPLYGSVHVEVPARNTSLECSQCGHISKDNRKIQAVFLCVQCEYGDHADRNAAINIRRRGIAIVAGGQPVIGLRAPKKLRTWCQPAQVVA